VSRSETSRSMRGTIRHRPNASRLPATVSSLPAPAAMYANASADIARLALAWSSSASNGTRGRRPLTPPR
jgi:hypothetical protein